MLPIAVADEGDYHSVCLLQCFEAMPSQDPSVGMLPYIQVRFPSPAEAPYVSVALHMQHSAPCGIQLHATFSYMRHSALCGIQLGQVCSAADPVTIRSMITASNILLRVDKSDISHYVFATI